MRKIKKKEIKEIQKFNPMPSNYHKRLTLIARCELELTNIVGSNITVKNINDNLKELRSYRNNKSKIIFKNNFFNKYKTSELIKRFYNLDLYKELEEHQKVFSLDIFRNNLSSVSNEIIKTYKNFSYENIKNQSIDNKVNMNTFFKIISMFSLLFEELNHQNLNNNQFKTFKTKFNKWCDSVLIDNLNDINNYEELSQNVIDFMLKRSNK